MNYYKIKEMICKISVVVFVLTVITASFFGIGLKPSGDKIFGMGFKTLYRTKGNPENSKHVFVVIQNNNERNNEVKTILELLRQNDLYHCYFKLGPDDDEHNVKECLEQIPPEQDIILISHFKSEALKNENIKGRIVLSPVEVDDVDIPTLLISSTVDRISTPKKITSIYNNLTDSKINETGFGFSAEKKNVSLKIVPSTVDKTTLLTAEYISCITNWINKNYGYNLKYHDYGFIRGWILILMALSSFLFFITEDIKIEIPENDTIPHIVNIKVENSFKFGLVRFFTWVGGIVLYLVLIIIISFIPKVDFTVRVIYSICIFTFGIIAWILYNKGIIPGIDGRIRYRDTMSSGIISAQKSLIFISPGVFILIAAVLLGFAELKFGFKEIIGFVLSSILIFSGFYVYNIDNYVLTEMRSVKTSKIFYKLSFFIPMLLTALACIPFAYPTWLYIGLITTFFAEITVMAGECMYKVNKDMVLTAIVESLFLSFFINFINLGGL